MNNDTSSSLFNMNDPEDSKKINFGSPRANISNKQQHLEVPSSSKKVKQSITSIKSGVTMMDPSISAQVKSPKFMINSEVSSYYGSNQPYASHLKELLQDQSSDSELAPSIRKINNSNELGLPPFFEDEFKNDYITP